MKGIYKPVFPTLHPCTVHDWHSSPSRLTFTNLSAPCALKSCSIAVYYCSIQKQFFSTHLWEQQSLVRWCEKNTCEKVHSILPLAAVMGKRDWHWCWWAMVYVNGWMGLIGISRSATAACHSETAMWMGPGVYGNINWTALTWSRTFRDSGSQRNCLVNIQSSINGWTSISSTTGFAWSLWIEVYWSAIESIIKIHHVTWTISSLMWLWWDEWLMSVTRLGIMRVEDRQTERDFPDKVWTILGKCWINLWSYLILHCNILAPFSLEVWTASLWCSHSRLCTHFPPHDRRLKVFEINLHVDKCPLWMV